MLPDPPLTDGELTLRPGHPEDAARAVAVLRGSDVPRWTRVPEHYTRADWEAFLALAAEEHAAATGLHLVIADAQDRLVGMVGLVGVDRERGYGEVGYWVAAEARGRGVAARAVGLLTAWARDALGLRALEILVHPDNAPSLRAAQRAGYVETGERRPAPREGVPPGLYRVLVVSDA